MRLIFYYKHIDVFQARRRDDDIAIVNGAFYFEMENSTENVHIIRSVIIICI